MTANFKTVHLEDVQKSSHIIQLHYGKKHSSCLVCVPQFVVTVTSLDEEICYVVAQLASIPRANPIHATNQKCAVKYHKEPDVTQCHKLDCASLICTHARGAV
jgi:hypothetical protein